jgi:hypothetical protein
VNATPALKRSFFTFAARYSLIAPFAAVGIALVLSRIEDPYNRYQPALFNVDILEDVAFFVCMSSLGMGIASLFGIRKHGAKRILWKALAGVLASGSLSFCVLVIIAARVCRQ